MKTKSLIIIVLLILSNDSIAQSLVIKTVENYSFNIAFGVNFIDNDNGGGIPFDADNWDFKRPFFISAERSISDNWTTSLTLSTNRLKLDDGITKNYYSADALVNLYLDKLLFNNEDFNVLMGLGVGMHHMGDKTKTNLNVSGGVRYWVSPRLGFSVNMIGKINRTNLEGVGNHYQLNTGLIWRIKGINPIAKNKTTLFEKNVISRLESIEYFLKSEPDSHKETKERETKSQNELNKIKDSLNVSIQTSKEKIIQKIEEVDLKYNKILDSINKQNNKKARVYTLGNPDGSSMVEKGYYIIVHVLKNKDNLDRLEIYLKERDIPYQIFKEYRTSRYYVSAGYFKTFQEALEFRNTKLNKEVFEDNWIFEQK